jgi:transcriptional regulator with XRE-family HTH domain
LTSVQVSRIERGRREIRVTTLLRLVEALEVSADQLLTG